MRATVVGSGPNGLAAAVTLARAGYAVRVLEAAETIGGGTRTEELTLPGFRHDVCSAVHPAAIMSPFFRAIGLDVEWLVPELSYAHPIPGQEPALAWRDIERTADGLGRDAAGWLRMLRPLTERIHDVVSFTSDQLLRVPAHPVTATRFGLRALELAGPLARAELRTPAARALVWGPMAHANTVLPSLGAAGAGLLLAAQAHAAGWPLVRGGSQAIADALLADLVAHGGSVDTGRRVADLGALDWGDPADGDVLMLDTSPRLLLTHPDLPVPYRRALTRFRYGAAVAKLDLALDGPVPWTDPALAGAVTVHLGGTAEQIRAAEREVAAGRMPHDPFVIVVQPSVVDPSRAPGGAHVVWAYAHVPNGWPGDAAEAVLARIEQFAPAVRERVLGAHAVRASEREAGNANEVGGDISGGAFTFRQAVVRPVLSAHPWRTPVRGVYLSSASTPPGPAVHGMNGWHAARLAIDDMLGIRLSLGDLARLEPRPYPAGP